MIIIRFSRILLLYVHVISASLSLFLQMNLVRFSCVFLRIGQTWKSTNATINIPFCVWIKDWFWSRRRRHGRRRCSTVENCMLQNGQISHPCMTLPACQMPLTFWWLQMQQNWTHQLKRFDIFLNSLCVCAPSVARVCHCNSFKFVKYTYLLPRAGWQDRTLISVW